MSIATENFVKAIYQSEQDKGHGTRPGSIAKALGITNAAATDMARKLAEKKLIHYEKYRELRLTSEGKKMALNIIRKHRLWETFLHKTFNMSLHEIHREAELLEHQTSEFLAEKISAFLGNPEFDPHGDPIPSTDGNVSSGKEHILLSRAEPGHNYEIKRLSASDQEFFKFCNNNNITVGSSLTVENQYSKNKITEININNIKLLLNAELSNLIYVKQINNNK